MGIPRELQKRLDSYGIKEDGGSTATQEVNTESEANQKVQIEPSSNLPEEQHIVTENIASEDAVTTDHSDSTSTVEHETSSLSNAHDANYKRMEGRYKAEIKRMETQLAELKEQARGASSLVDILASTREELATLRAKAQPETPASVTPEIPELTSEEMEMFGDFAPVADKLIAKATAPLLKEIEALKTRTGEVDKRVGSTTEAMFVGDVRARVAEFDQVVQDPAWQEYLNRPVPFTRLSMSDALREAHHARDLERVIGIFNAFTSQVSEPVNGITAPPTTAPKIIANGQVSAQTAPATPKNTLAQFVTPDRTAVNPSGKSSPQYRQSDYHAKLSEMLSGRITKEKFQQFDKDFYEAKRNGLVS